MDKSFRKDLAAQLAAITESRQMKSSDLTNPEKALKRHITGPREIPAEPELLIQEMGSGAFHTLWPPYSLLTMSETIYSFLVMFLGATSVCFTFPDLI